MLVDGTEYIGFYHTYIDGTVLTGAEYNAVQSKTLIPYVSSDENTTNSVYNSLRPISNAITPLHSFAIPTLEDYKQGKIVRYFIKKRNYNNINDLFEINETQFNLWQSRRIDYTLYTATSMDWKLTGPLNDVKTTTVEYGVYDTNMRMVNLKEKEFAGIASYLTDYIELSIYSKYVSDDIKKLFGSLK